MQKYRSLWWYGVFGTITGVAIFLVMGMRLFAAEISSEEVYFTHVHTNACYRTVTYSCESTHTCWKGYVEYKTLHCSICGSSVNHKVVCDSWNCSTKNLYWQTNVVATCTVCGNVQPAWSNYNPAAHQTTGTQLACGLTEGEQTVGIRIQADNSPTNSGVTLTVTRNVIKEDALLGEILYDWGENSRTVTENGTYTVVATGSMGASVSTSITISCIDKGLPVIQGITHEPSSVTQNSVTVTVSATDNESGLADSAYSTDGGATWNSRNTFAVSEGNDVQLVVRDKAGNTVSKTVKRSEFPYPPKPTPAPTPQPTAQPTPKPVYTPLPTADATVSSGEETVSATPVPTPAGEASVVEESEKAQKDTGAKKVTPTEDVLDENIKETDYVQDKTAEEQEADTEKEAVPAAPNSFLGDRQEGAGNGMVLHNTIVQAEDDEPKPVCLYEKSTAFSGKEAGEGGRLHRLENTEQATGDYSVSDNKKADIIKAGATMILGVAVLSLAFFGVSILWRKTAVLYCYDGGDAYKKLGLFFLRKNEENLELYLPEYLTESTDILRYRLLVKKGLVNKFSGRDLVVYSEDGALHRPLEECVDFVL